MASNSHVLVSYDNATKEVISWSYLTPPIPYVGTLYLVGSCHGLVCFAVRIDNNFELLLELDLLLCHMIGFRCRCTR